jgi:hypothetical protein
MYHTSKTEKPQDLVNNNDAHIQEWRESAIDEGLIALNLETVTGDKAYERILYALPDDARRNDGRLRDGWLNRYAHLENGGWAFAGCDPLTGQDSEWGCVKPDSPRWDAKKRKPIKYEHPVKTPTKAFFLKVTPSIWEKIADKYKVAIAPYNLCNPYAFWAWVIAHPELPIVITEGVKKTASAISAGYIAVGLPGVWNGIRKHKGDQGKRVLIHELAIFASEGREFIFAFDNDVKPQTVANVRKALLSTFFALISTKANATIARWDGAKGLDDLIKDFGIQRFDRAIDNRIDIRSLSIEETRQIKATSSVNARYIGDAVDVSDLTAKIVAIRSPKGTGKSVLLAAKVKNAIAEGKKVIVIGHRTRLLMSLAKQFGVSYVADLDVRQGHNPYQIALCIDSLRMGSQANFQAGKWEDALVVIDECEQVLWHLFSASTEVGKHRPIIIKNLKALIENCGQLIIADADLSGISLRTCLKSSLNPLSRMNSSRSRLKR